MIDTLIDKKVFSEVDSLRASLEGIANHPALATLVRKSIVEIRLKQQQDSRGCLPISDDFMKEVKEIVEYVLNG